MYSVQFVLLAVALEMCVAQMLKLEVSDAVVAGIDSSFSQPCSGCRLEVLQPHF